MSTGTVIYGTDPARTELILEVAENLFHQFCEKATRAIFLKFVARGGEGVIDGHETSLSDLRVRISAGEVAAFQVFSGEEKEGRRLFHFAAMFRNFLGCRLSMCRSINRCAG
ncbi:MAG: hypothetical protein IOC39_19225 [Burkholderia sp.]|jgi:hypothetical protein|uniref:hypothetical protein n=1 Tax=Burkholderia sp. TaxID=36773 RepID=UPI0025885ABF|nr:hypothetical protein [Burkholderia sp.]MCA3779523.1 hypothetical protein [Burkholderia sp.]MCA3793860.1 hypothetical protein [Burkholderia sp.]MCA3812749.1 hypothetical protein [Burkholderia sp.]MCA3817956.1 hypothetical protein [Burkholderia sp.]MCA3832496.1 hypothetical protein [Burkholderia sp.]